MTFVQLALLDLWRRPARSVLTAAAIAIGIAAIVSLTSIAWGFEASWQRANDLRGTDLGGADLSGANLGDADLSYTDLSTATLLDADLSNAKYNASTTWPQDFDPAAAGAVLGDQ